MLKTHIDLFSGIGGFALAANWAGYQTEIFCERDEFCQKVLGKHWPTVPIVGDIFDFDGTQHAGADLLTAEIPCQPYSCAGKQLGAEDDRALWPEALRVIREARTRWVVIENVSGFINLALDGVLSDLEAEGYETGAVVLPACAVNAKHRRDRVWIVAHDSRTGAGMEAYRSRGQERESARTLESAVLPQAVRAGGAEGINASFEDVAHADREGLQRRDSSQLCERPDERAARESRPHAPDPYSEPLGWATEPRGQRGGGQSESRVGWNFDGLSTELDRPFGSGPEQWDGDWERGAPRVAKGAKDRAKRLKALGNAIVPQVAYQILSAIDG